MTFLKPVRTRNVLRAFREGQSGWEVQAYQLNLRQAGHPTLVVDGSFGATTRLATVHFQRDHGLLTDGIAGPTTCLTLFIVIARPYVVQYGTPTGLAKGIGLGESGCDPACVSEVYDNGTCDLGGWQNNEPVNVDSVTGAIWVTDVQAFFSFDLAKMANDTLGKIRRRHDAYIGCNTKVAWQLATLYHNREADADTLAVASAHMAEIDWSIIPDDNKYWQVFRDQDGNIVAHYSHREWCQKYVLDKTKYVLHWPN